MEIIFIIIAVIFVLSIIGRLTQEKKESKSANTFKNIVQKTFPKYKIIEKNQQIMICEINHRNEPDELVFIRIGGSKNIRKSGRMLIVNYPKEPTVKEMKQDLGRHLN